MAEVLQNRLWLGRIGFVLLALGLIFALLLPIGTLDRTPPAGHAAPDAAVETLPEPRLEDVTVNPAALPAAALVPDLLMLLSFLWVARRPDHAPLPLIAAVWFLADLIFGRPPGLMAALMVIATEVLRARAGPLKGMPVVAEWITVGVLIAAVTAAYRFGLTMAIVSQGPAGPVIIQTIVTIAAYPLAIGLAYAVFGMTRPQPGETDAMGRPL
jgi:rod shape-determining protein MreD